MIYIQSHKSYSQSKGSRQVTEELTELLVLHMEVSRERVSLSDQIFRRIWI